ncbi:hypothetical protein [Paenibacillus elgii]|uniref:hypothetical protein n=1 Tax=Paenibacillus elgii TaxID=189691 RepID=UPI000248D275|nr:hypothetical protein [Paenibacillus elgii]
MFNRNKSVFLIGMAVVMLFVSSGCAKEKTDEEKLAEAIQKSIANSANKTDASTKKEEPTVESKLAEISNFITGTIWNEGFVDISWYKSDGTSSTGKELDIDFTIDRLGKEMDKKAEYDAYIKGLDAKYDNVKQVWTKLSGETDNLYKQLKENKPQAKDKSYKFNTGLFEQYSKAFKDDVQALKKK